MLQRALKDFSSECPTSGEFKTSPDPIKTKEFKFEIICNKLPRKRKLRRKSKNAPKNITAKSMFQYGNRILVLNQRQYIDENNLFLKR